MTQQMPYANARATKAMNPEQLNQIVEAILAGKYSWACVLLLRCAGYNPLHYYSLPDLQQITERKLPIWQT
ncbi:MAG: HetP family heterocyst commitment protein [Potamolinea sp.]